MRKLVTTARIISIDPIEGADAIEVAKIRGWNVVVGKGSHFVGEVVAFFEIDSSLPIEDPRFEQFAARGVKTLPNGEKVHRLRTIKLRGQISQGLVMSLNELGLDSSLPEDVDLTEDLGVALWEIPESMPNHAKGNFPTQFADKTDSERVQNLSDRQWREINQHPWYATEKVDGSSITLIMDHDGTHRVCSRNLELASDAHMFVKAEESGLFDKMVPGMVIQGELVGPGIQNNRLKLDAQRILVFDVWQDRVIVPRDSWPEGIDVVPVVPLEFPQNSTEAEQQVYKMRSLVNPKVQAEGVVWHTVDGSTIMSLGRSTFKSINADFLLKEK